MFGAGPDLPFDGAVAAQSLWINGSGGVDFGDRRWLSLAPSGENGGLDQLKTFLIMLMIGGPH